MHPNENDAFNFREWVEHAGTFIAGLPHRIPGEFESEVNVLPPLSPEDVAALGSSLGIPIPTALRSFLVEGSAGFEFRYGWEPIGSRREALKSALSGESDCWGSGEFCKASRFCEWEQSCKQWAEETWVAEYPEDLAFWTRSFPIVAMDNGDYLGLDCRESSDNPAVVYLSHDEESKIIAASFTDFLAAWAQIAFVGPESWLLEGFLDADGLLDPDTSRAKELRNMLGIED